MIECPICRTPCERYPLGFDRFDVICTLCGQYSLTNGAIVALKGWPAEMRACLCLNTRAASDYGTDLALTVSNLVAYSNRDSLQQMQSSVTEARRVAAA